MKAKSLPFFEAVAILIGSIIGAGILGIPYAAAKAGWIIVVIYLVCLGTLLMGLNLMLGEVVVRTKRPLQIPGLAAKYLGRYGKTAVSFITLFGAYGALLAYIIGTGQILQALLGGIAGQWSIVFWLFASLIVFFGLRLVQRLDMLLTLTIFVFLIALVFISAPQIHLPNLFSNISWQYLLLPYGVVLFALQGINAIPQAEAVLPAQQKQLKAAIIAGSLLPVVIYLIFFTTVLGVTGATTTSVASVGLGQRLGPAVVLIANLFALFTMGTCFVNTAVAVRKQFEWDYSMRPLPAWFLTVYIPLVVFVLGARDFIKTIDFLGAIFGGLNAIVIVAIYWQAKKKGDLPARGFQLSHTTLLSVLIVIVFVVGAILTILGLA